MTCFNRPVRLLLCALAASAALVGCGGGGGGGSSAPATTPTPVTTPVLTNVVPLVVDGGPIGNTVNVPYATVTVCQPGSQTQ